MHHLEPIESYDLVEKAETVGPVLFKTKVGSKKMEESYICFQPDKFFIFCSAGKDKNGEATVSKLCLEVLYKEIVGLESNVKIISLLLASEPFWEILQEGKTTRFQKDGFLSISFSTKKAIVSQIRKTLFIHAPRLLEVRPLPKEIAKMDQVQKQLTDITFSIPEGLFESITSFTASSIECVSKIDVENAFKEKYHFSLEKAPLHFATEAIDPIFTLKEIMDLEFSSLSIAFLAGSYGFSANAEHCILKGIETEEFISDPPITVNVFRSTIKIPKIPINEVLASFNGFLKTGAWQKIDAVVLSKPVGLWMSQIHNRDTWTVPLISFESSTETYAIISFNQIKSMQHVLAIREAQPFGKFKKGVGNHWLPDVFQGSFIFEIKGEMLSIEFVEMIGWDFDPQLFDYPLDSLALKRCGIVASLGYFLQNRLS